MATLMSLKPKSKDFIFTSYGNDKEEKPAKIIFSRFPAPSETFTQVDKKNIFEGIDLENVKKRELQSEIANKIVESYMQNFYAGLTDLKLFFRECVDHVEDLVYNDNGKILHITTTSEFWQILPQGAAYEIAQEAFDYAQSREEFTMGNLNA